VAASAQSASNATSAVRVRAKTEAVVAIERGSAERVPGREPETA
jgi:hypothetical protein